MTHDARLVDLGFKHDHHKKIHPCLMYLHIFSAAITNTKRNSSLIAAVTVHLVPRIVYTYMFLLFSRFILR